MLRRPPHQRVIESAGRVVETAERVTSLTATLPGVLCDLAANFMDASSGYVCGRLAAEAQNSRYGKRFTELIQILMATGQCLHLKF